MYPPVFYYFGNNFYAVTTLKGVSKNTLLGVAYVIRGVYTKISSLQVQWFGLGVNWNSSFKYREDKTQMILPKIEYHYNL